MPKIFIAVMAGLLILGGLLADDSVQAESGAFARAKELFQKYVALEHQFDPAIAALYSDAALIQNRRTYPTGQVKVIKIPAPQYKELIRQAMPLGKARGDVSTYSEVTYALEGDRVRIKATRYSELKKYSSPISLLVGSDATGKWLVHEELSESQP